MICEVLSSRRFFLAAVILLCVGVEIVRGADDRLPVPDAAALRKAKAAVADLFEAKLSGARTPDERAVVTREMLAVLPSTKDPAERYAILVAAIDTATRGKDPGVVLAIADVMSREYRLERVDLIEPRIAKLSGPIPPEAWMDAAPKLVDLARECISAARFDAAESLIAAYAQLGKRAKDARASGIVASLRKSLAAGREAEGKLAELAAAAQRPAADPKAFTELGRELCFVRGDWSAGLPYLSKSSDPDLAAIAAMDIAAETPQQRMAVAQAWASLGNKQVAEEQEAFFDRSTTIFTDILPRLSGLEKVKAEKAYEAILESATTKGQASAAWVVVFRSADPKFWNTDSRADPLNYAVPIASVPATMRYVRLRRAGGDAIVMPLTKASLGSEWKGDVYGWQGARKEIHGAHALGIFDTRTSVDAAIGKVAIYSGSEHYTGWGFGHRVRHGGPSQACWAGEFIPIEPIEISVTARQLKPAEKRCLLP